MWLHKPTGQQVERSILGLRLGYDSYQNSSHSPTLSPDQYNLTVKNRGLKHHSYHLYKPAFGWVIWVYRSRILEMGQQKGGCQRRILLPHFLCISLFPCVVIQTSCDDVYLSISANNHTLVTQPTFYVALFCSDVSQEI